PACGSGWRRVSLYGELPPGTHLVAAPQATGPVRVRVTTEAGTTTAYDGATAALPAALPLGVDGDEPVLARLDLEADDCARWDGAALQRLARPSPPPVPPVRNVALIVIDTLRSDRLAPYGPTRVQTPRMTALAARGAVFLQHQSMAPSSPPSHATIHSGQIPRVHGVIGDDTEPGATTPILAALLGDAGFFTAFVGNNDFAMTRLRRAAGWDVAETPYYRHGKDCGPMMARAVELAGQAVAAGQRFFLSTLPIEPHVAYRFHEGVTDTYFAGPWPKPIGKQASSKSLGRMKTLPGDHPDWARVRALYDGEVTHVDACVGALEDGLRELGVLDDTAIVITSDHGEGMGERKGAAGHAYSLNRELVDVPLIVAGGVSPARVPSPSSNLDVAPTILALLGLPADPRMQGRTLTVDAAGEHGRGWWPASGRSHALRLSHWHLVVDYAGRGRLYDRVRPAELTDRVADAPLAARALRDAQRLYLAHRSDWRGATWGDLGALAPGNPLVAE
ncbi:MAG: sulfatase, partial [Kofleriaceae bacterium]